MNFHILTLFPEMVMQGLMTSITGRAVKQNKIGIEAVNIRDYTQDKHKKVDDYPYGGGAGMVMHNGVKIIKPIILVVLVLLLIKVISGM